MISEIEITLNGEKTRVPAGLDVLGLLRHLELDLERVAIELDRQIIRRHQWESAPIRPGAELEIVHFVGGGR